MTPPDQASASTRLGGLSMRENLARSPGALGAAALCVLLALAALAAPWIAPVDPYDLRSQSILDSHPPPAWIACGDPRFVLGTDEQGVDLLSTMLYGLRLSLGIGLASVCLSLLVGVTLGLVSR